MDIKLIREQSGYHHLLKAIVNGGEIIDFQYDIINKSEQINFIKVNYDSEYLIYDITSLVPIEIYFKNYCIDYEKVKYIFIEIINSLQISEEYLLDLDKIMLEEKNIYFNSEEKNINFIYLPINANYELSFHKKLKKIFLSLLFQNFNIESISENKNFIRIIEYLQSGEFDIFAFKTILENDVENIIEIKKKDNWITNLFKSNKKTFVVADNHTDYIIDESATIMLETMEELPYLEFENSQKILINKDRFLIGRSSDLVDYPLVDELALGRVHAEIIKRNDKFYIIDIHTKNGTFVNNVRIESQKEYSIKKGDKIQFANKSSVFNI